ncbi:hypothetical protein [uncultured Nitrosomonas sp.]|uniref:hypothetical protein n=1 Tax=uncultured Nitrosomonas sp. TaxID=156424 RepID=UPI0025D79E72|nr:hypothetical protein [uncultured Nitrosomonas sp.]
MSWVDGYYSNHRHSQQPRLPVIGIVSMTFAIGLAGCSTQQLYTTGQSWQRNECNRLMDHQDRDHCLSSTSTSYETYKKQSGTGSDPK